MSKPNPFGTEGVQVIRDNVGPQKGFEILADGAERMNKWIVEDCDAYGATLDVIATQLQMGLLEDAEAKADALLALRTIAKRLKNDV